MDSEFTRWLVSQGSVGVLAAMLFWFYRKDVRQYTELWRAQTDLARIQTGSLIDVIRDETASNTRMIALLEAMHRRFDQGTLRVDLSEDP